MQTEIQKTWGVSPLSPLYTLKEPENMMWGDQVAPFNMADNCPPLSTEAEIAEISAESDTKLFLNSLSPSLSAVLSRFVMFFGI
jgi:hypothetical protein